MYWSQQYHCHTGIALNVANNIRLGQRQQIIISTTSRRDNWRNDHRDRPLHPAYDAESSCPCTVKHKNAVSRLVSNCNACIACPTHNILNMRRRGFKIRHYGKSQIGLVERVEMQVLKAFINQFTALVNRHRCGNVLARIGIFFQPLIGINQPLRLRTAASGAYVWLRQNWWSA